MKVVVAEDSLVNARAAQRLVEQLGHESVLAADGEEAVAAAAAADLVLMDCEMPVVDGYEAARRIRAAEAGGRRVPIVAMTAHQTPGERERCLAAGMDDFVGKPLRAEVLSAILGRWGGGDVAAAIDAERFGEMEEDFSPEDVKELVAAFLDTTPDHVADVLRAGERRDGEELRAAAHKLKGGCLAVGALPLARAATRVEELVFAGPLDDRVDAAVADLDRWWQATAASLRAKIS